MFCSFLEFHFSVTVVVQPLQFVCRESFDFFCAQYSVIEWVTIQTENQVNRSIKKYYF